MIDLTQANYITLVNNSLYFANDYQSYPTIDGNGRVQFDINANYLQSYHHDGCGKFFHDICVATSDIFLMITVLCVVQ